MRLLSAIVASLILSLTNLSSFAIAGEELPELTILTEDWPPYQYLEEGELKGYSVEVLEAVLEKAGSSQTRKDFRMVPWARGVSMLDSEPNTLLFLMTRTRERAPKYQWVGPLFHNISYVIAKRGSGINIDSPESFGQLKPGAINGDVSENYLIELGFEKEQIAQTNHSESLVLMLNFGRVDLIIDNWANFQSVVEAQSLDPNTFEAIGVANTDGVSFALSMQTPDWLVRRLQSAFEAMWRDGSVDAIRESYGIEADPQLRF